MYIEHRPIPSRDARYISSAYPHCVILQEEDDSDGESKWCRIASAQAYMENMHIDREIKVLVEKKKFVFGL